MGLRQVAQTLTAKRISGDKTFYGRVSNVKWAGRPNVVDHVFSFWAMSGSGLVDGEIFYSGDSGKYYLLVARTPIIVKNRERFITGVALNANASCTVQTLSSGSPDGFGYSVKTWVTKLTTFCNFFAGSLDVDQSTVMALPTGTYSITISRTTELLYKVVKGDRIIINGTDYKVTTVDDTKYTTDAYICQVIEDDRS